MATSVVAEPGGNRAASAERPPEPAISQRVVVAIVAVELLFLYAPTLGWLWGRWTENVWEHAHGLLIVPLVGYFIFQELRPYRLHPPASNAWGFAFLIPALALHVLDTGMHTQLLSAAALVAALPGLSLLLLGTERTRAAVFPLALLVLALPIPLAFTEQIHWELRRFVTETMGAVLPLLGISVYTESTTILMPGGSLQIADACSGFTTMYAAVAVALLTAYTATDKRRRFLVLLSAIPLAIAANLLRILTLALLVVWRGPTILDTFVHPLSGLMTFALALPIIFWLGGDVRSASTREQIA